jgi:hypothetical protein
MKLSRLEITGLSSICSVRLLYVGTVLSQVSPSDGFKLGEV